LRAQRQRRGARAAAARCVKGAPREAQQARSAAAQRYRLHTLFTRCVMPMLMLLMLLMLMMLLLFRYFILSFLFAVRHLLRLLPDALIYAFRAEHCYLLMPDFSPTMLIVFPPSLAPSPMPPDTDYV